MNLSDYSEIVALYDPFTPEANASNSAPLDAAHEAALNDANLKPYAAQLAANPNKREELQAALTVRPPGGLAPDLLAATDHLLQRELADKEITDAASLPRLSGAYPAAKTVSIWNGDISTLKVDAIVNAANAQLLGCFQPFHACIDNVIHCAAGPRLREDCQAIMTVQGHPEPTGEAKITRAYNLPSMFVLHTVGPIIPTGQQPTAEQQRQLAGCYESCLSLAAEAGVRSVAFCGISTGVFGYPPDKAADVALETVADWLRRSNGTIEHVIFNTFGNAATETYENATRKWKHHETD